MKRLVGPRFGAEAAFILAVAAVAFLLELEPREIFAAMLGAWILVAIAELGLSRRRPAPAAADAAPEPEPQLVPPPPPTLDRLSRREPEPEPEPEESQPPAPVEIAPPPPEAEPEPGPDEEPEPELEPAAEAPRLEAVPELEAEPEPEPDPEPEPVVVPLIPAAPREWNLWELERWARDRAPDDPARAEEWNFVLLHLREFATPEGTLPRGFDGLVRETFGEVLEPTA